jgi:2,4-dienoyl-CoA reductase (NADPH2)
VSADLSSSKRGHKVTLYESGERIGGQFELARHIPGLDVVCCV